MTRFTWSARFLDPHGNPAPGLMVTVERFVLEGGTWALAGNATTRQDGNAAGRGEFPGEPLTFAPGLRLRVNETVISAAPDVAVRQGAILVIDFGVLRLTSAAQRFERTGGGTGPDVMLGGGPAVLGTEDTAVRAELEALRRQQTEGRAELEALRRQRDEGRTELETVRRQLREAQAAAADDERALRERDAEVQRLTALMAARDEERAGFERRHAALTEQLAARQREVTALGAEVQRLTAQVTARDADIARVAARQAALEAELAARRQEVDAQTAELRRLRESLATREAELAAARAERPAPRVTRVTDLVSTLGAQLDEAQGALRTREFSLGGVAVSVKALFHDDGGSVEIPDREALRTLPAQALADLQLSFQPDRTGPAVPEQKVPDVMYLTANRARAVLASLGLALEASTGPRALNPAAAAGQAMLQTPAPGQPIAHGQRVHVIFATQEA